MKERLRHPQREKGGSLSQCKGVAVSLISHFNDHIGPAPAWIFDEKD